MMVFTPEKGLRKKKSKRGMDQLQEVSPVVLVLEHSSYGVGSSSRSPGESV